MAEFFHFDPELNAVRKPCLTAMQALFSPSTSQTRYFQLTTPGLTKHGLLLPGLLVVWLHLFCSFTVVTTVNWSTIVVSIYHNSLVPTIQGYPKYNRGSSGNSVFHWMNSCPLKTHCMHIPVCSFPEVVTLKPCIWDDTGPSELKYCDINTPWTKH